MKSKIKIWGTVVSVFWGYTSVFKSSPPGEIRVQKDNSLDFEESPQIQLVVLADSGLQTAHCRVSISLLDVNDNAPVFEHSGYRTAVWEGQAHNTYIMQVWTFKTPKQVYRIFSRDKIVLITESVLLYSAGVCVGCWQRDERADRVLHRVR